MMGTYRTIDSPTKKQDEAFDFLSNEFAKIGGRVRRMINHHDFGSYLSFEVDYPQKIERMRDEIDILEDYIDEEEEKLFNEYNTKVNDWNNEAEEICKKYNKKFSEWL